MGLFGQALARHFLSRRFEALAFGLHPLREFGGQQRQRRLGTRHRIVIFRGRLRNRLVQRVRRRNDFVVGELATDGEVSLRALIPFSPLTFNLGPCRPGAAGE